MPEFRVDTLGHGERRFTGCTLLHKMIASQEYSRIIQDSAWMLTEEALNDYSCEYDSWDNVSPLWLLTMTSAYLSKGHKEETLELVDLMLK